jgi:formylglycine-generating enzyme required for sulfatase activity
MFVLSWFLNDYFYWNVNYHKYRKKYQKEEEEEEREENKQHDFDDFQKQNTVFFKNMLTKVKEWKRRRNGIKFVKHKDKKNKSNLLNI